MQQGTLAAQKRGDVARLEGQLRFAYAEIDRLNAVALRQSGKRGGPQAEAQTDVQTDAHGFALTRPYER